MTTNFKTVNYVSGLLYDEESKVHKKVHIVPYDLHGAPSGSFFVFNTENFYDRDSTSGSIPQEILDPDMFHNFDLVLPKRFKLDTVSHNGGSIRLQDHPHFGDQLICSSLGGFNTHLVCSRNIPDSMFGNIMKNLSCGLSMEIYEHGDYPDFPHRAVDYILAPQCNHEWITTQGFSSTYTDCKHCGAKK